MHVPAAAQNAHDHRSHQRVERRGSRVAAHHGRADGCCGRGEAEQRQDKGPQDQPEEQLLGKANGNAGAQRHQSEGLADGKSALAVAHADLFADDYSRGRSHAEDAGSDHAVDAAGNGLRGDDLGTDGHVAHDHREHRGAKAPERLVEQHGRGVFDEIAEDVHSRAGDAAPLQRHARAAQGIDRADGEFQHAGEQRGDRRTADAKGREAQLAENQNVVAQRVEHGGRGKHQHAEAGVLRAALHADIDRGQGVEDVRNADNAQIRHCQHHQTGIVRDQIEHPLRCGAHHQCGECRNAAGHKNTNAQHAIDGFPVAFAPVLADQHTGPALQSENHQLQDEHRNVRHRESGHLLTAEQADHERVDKAERGGDEVLQYHRQRKRSYAPVKAPGLAQTGKHGCAHHSMGKREARWASSASASASISARSVSGPKLMRSTPAAVFLGRFIAA